MGVNDRLGERRDKTSDFFVFSEISECMISDVMMILLVMSA